MLLNSTIAAANTDLSLAIGESFLADYSIRGLDVQMTITTNGLSLSATADSIALPAPIGTLTNIQLNCLRFKLGPAMVSCVDGELTFSHLNSPQRHIALSFTVYPEHQVYLVSMASLSTDESHWTADVEYWQEQWKIDASVEQFDLSTLQKLAEHHLPSLDRSLIIDWQAYVKGQQAIIQLSGRGTQINELTTDITLSHAAFSRPDGLYVAESVEGAIQLSAHWDNAWRWQQVISLKAGQSYFHPIFLDFSETPITFSSSGIWSNRQIQIEQFEFEHENVLTLAGQLSIDDDSLSSVKAALDTKHLDETYQTWVKPFVANSFLTELNMNGQLASTIVWQGADYEIEVEIDQVEIHDPDKRLAVTGLTGQAGWSTQDTVVPINLAWQQFYLGRIPIDHTTIHAQVEKGTLTLLSEVTLPIFDGALQVKHFALNHEQDDVTWQFEGEVHPISMHDISQALAWPIMDGKLSGTIPKVHYAAEQIHVDGALNVNIFDGNVMISDLMIQSPFGSLPQVQANIDIKQLDLELITQTFDFGKITGHIEGYVHDLRMVNWQPIHFSAAIQSPHVKRDKRRISQRAVDNLTQVGGGVGGALSRSFMRFFDDFSYDKLGLRCRLENNVCLMSGIEAAEEGYYIVKGGGLPPWINVMGYNERVDWPELINRLKVIKDSEGPVIE